MHTIPPRTPLPIPHTPFSPYLTQLHPFLSPHTKIIMMGTVCTDHQHKFHHSHQLLLSKKSLRDLDIPPRKQLLLGRRADPESGADTSPGFSKFLPYNDGDDSDSDDPYSSDHFRMYEFKVRKCNRSRSHDWTDCPFAHPGEKARRRDPRRYHYSGVACLEFRRNSGCRRGDACEFAHGVFESWLHPARYRTQPCRDGRGCRRKVCFFAHTPAQLRLLPSSDSASSSPFPASATGKATITAAATNGFCSCGFCPYKSASATQLASSPTSTLMGLSHLSSPPLSPPLSPVYTPPVDSGADHGVLSYNSLLTDLVGSLEAMDLSAFASPSPSASASSKATVDAFLLSPASSSTSRDYSYTSYGKDEMNNDINPDGSGFSNNNIGCPDLDWVNDLVM